jgi:hypothetical protein
MDPALIGSNRARLSLRDGVGRAVDGGALRLRAVAPPGSGLSTSVVQLAREGLEYQCLLSLGAAGEWTLEVLVGESEVVPFRVDIPSLAGEHAGHATEETGTQERQE